MSLIGYARVSTENQDLSSQIDSLESAGCEKIFTDKVSGATTERLGLNECLDTLQPGDTLVVWRLDRLGRTTRYLIALVNDLKERGIGFKSICDGVIDTTTASGELVFNIFASLAQFERELIRERINAGLKAARARGRLGGRRPIDPLNPKVLMAKKMFKDKRVKVAQVCDTLGISRATFYRYVSMPEVGRGKDRT